MPGRAHVHAGCQCLLKPKSKSKPECDQNGACTGGAAAGQISVANRGSKIRYWHLRGGAQATSAPIPKPIPQTLILNLAASSFVFNYDFITLTLSPVTGPSPSPSCSPSRALDPHGRAHMYPPVNIYPPCTVGVVPTCTLQSISIPLVL